MNSAQTELITNLKVFDYEEHEVGQNFNLIVNYKELVELPLHGFAEIELKDGTILLISTSEYSSIYVKVTES